MRSVNMREAKTHLSRLVEAASRGEPFVIARAGKPVVKVVALDAPEAGHRIGFLAGRNAVLLRAAKLSVRSVRCRRDPASRPLRAG